MLYFKIKERFKDTALVITLFSLVVFLTLLSFQGFDVCDEGWYMSFYQQIFNKPESVEYNFAFWLTGIVGGLWYEVFPHGGILSFRALTTLVIVSTFLLAYKIHTQYLGKKLIILIALLMVVFINDFGYLAFYYNHLSSILALGSIYFLLKGIEKNNRYYLLIAGCIVAINVLSRLPNVTLFAFALIFPVQILWTTCIHHYWIRQIGFFLLGSAVGVLIGFTALYSFGHLDIFKRAIMLILDKGEQADSNHNIWTLSMVYVNDYKMVLKQGIKLLIVLVPIVLAYKWISKYKLLTSIWWIVSLMLLTYIFRERAIHTLYFIGLLGSVAIIFMKAMPIQIKNLAVVAVLMTVLLPLGSDGGIHNAGYVAVWLSLPLSLWFIFELKFIPILKFETGYFFNRSAVKTSISLLVMGFFILKMHNISIEAYFDHGSRLNKTYAVNSPFAKGVFTTEKRAEIINDLLPQLEKYVQEEDYLLAYDKIPMINYLTNTKPYMYISWVWVYDSHTFEKQLKRAEHEIDGLPIVVQQKFETIQNFSEPEVDYMSENKIETYRYKSGRVKAMNAFLARNNYVIVWSNPYFNILKPY